MKKNIRNFLLSAAVLMLGFSFTEGPVAPQPATLSDELSVVPDGGAYLVFAGKFGGEITRKEIASNNELKVNGCAVGSLIFQFTLDITKSGKTTSMRGESNVLTKEMISKLKSLSVGDEFEFKKTKAYLPNGKEVVDVHGKKFVVSEKGA